MRGGAISNMGLPSCSRSSSNCTLGAKLQGEVRAALVGVKVRTHAWCARGVAPNWVLAGKSGPNCTVDLEVDLKISGLR